MDYKVGSYLSAQPTNIVQNVLLVTKLTKKIKDSRFKLRYMSDYSTSNLLTLISSNQLACLQRDTFQVFSLSPKVQIAIYRRNFKDKIFTDITMPAKLFLGQILVSKHKLAFRFDSFPPVNCGLRQRVKRMN